MNPLPLAWLPASGPRAFIGLVSFVLIAAGAGMLWGAGASMLILGLVLWIDTSSDEVVERITRVARSTSPPRPISSAERKV